VRLTPRQRRLLWQVVSRLHARDADRCRLPAIDRGPTRGLWRAAVAAVDGQTPLPDLRELPPNATWAVVAVSTLRQHPLTAAQVDRWLIRNLAGTYAPRHLESGMPLVGCRSWEDVRNRLIVDMEHASPSQLGRWESVVVPGSIERALQAAQGLASSGRGGVESTS